MKIILKSKQKLHYAEADYSNTGTVTVFKGSKINPVDSFPKMSSDALKARKDLSIVDANGNVKKDVIFNSPSTAAQFVTGRSSNGYIAWRPDDKMSLKEYLKNMKTDK